MTAQETPEAEKEPLFFSYAHADRERAVVIIHALEAHGYSVWWDDNLDGGNAFATSIEDALNAAKAVVVLWSEHSIKSHWVSDEADQGRNRGCLIPLLVDGVQPPLGFRQLHFIDMEKWNGAADAPEFERLLRAVASYTDGQVATLQTPLSPSHGFPVSQKTSVHTWPRRNVLLAGGGAAALGVAGFASMPLFQRAPALAANGVAVLPFRNLSGDPEQDYLSAGLAAEVRAVLARNAALLVVAQASCEAVTKRALGAAEMARTLAVSFLLDGHVTRTGDKFRVAAELIDGRTGFSRWSETFERPLEELTTIQDAIATAVTAQLTIGDSDNKDDGSYGETSNATAFNDYLKGKELYAAAISHETDLSALSFFDRAIERDGAFGAAHAARARTLTVLGNTSDDVERARLYYESARTAAARAVDAGPASADAHSTLGYVLFQAQLRIGDAREPYERSYALGRGNASVLARYAAFAACTKQFDEATRAVNAARDLDPLNAVIHRAVGFVHYAMGNHTTAIEAVNRALSLNPALSDSHARIATAQIALARPVEAVVSAQKERSGLVRYPALAIAHYLNGDIAQADEAFEALVSQYGDAGLYQQVQILAQWGRADEAMGQLEKAKEVGDSGLTYSYMDPALETLRTRDDFQALLRGLGFL